jgi:predicted AlkP superfamily phosphohydrolase/phosphomutase
MKGAFCINQWLIKEGYLALDSPMQGKTSIEKAPINWSKTTAWAWGGYYARIFLNVQGREAAGIIKPEDYEKLRDQLSQAIKEIRGPHGEFWNTRVFKPEEVFPQCNGDYPDLIVYLDDLYWRSAGTIGHDTLYLPENDTGPDDAVHSEEGMFILYYPGGPTGRRDGTIYDIAPTMLHLLGISPSPGLKGDSLLWKNA